MLSGATGYVTGVGHTSLSSAFCVCVCVCVVRLFHEREGPLGAARGRPPCSPLLSYFRPNGAAAARLSIEPLRYRPERHPEPTPELRPCRPIIAVTHSLISIDVCDVQKSRALTVSFGGTSI